MRQKLWQNIKGALHWHVYNTADTFHSKSQRGNIGETKRATNCYLQDDGKLFRWAAFFTAVRQPDLERSQLLREEWTVLKRRVVFNDSRQLSKAVVECQIPCLPVTATRCYHHFPYDHCYALVSAAISVCFRVLCSLLLCVCLCVCLSVCPQSYLRNYMSNLHQIFCAYHPRPWMSPPLAV